MEQLINLPGITATRLDAEGNTIETWDDETKIGGDILTEAMEILNKKEEKIDKIRIPVFNEDTLFTLKCKIALAFGIPVYRLSFLFGDPNEADTDPTYRFVIEGSQQIDTSMHLLWEPQLDMSVVRNRDTIKITSVDFYKTVSELSTTEIYCVDLASFKTFLDHNSEDLEYIYYGFVVKFWPMMSYEMFEQYQMGVETSKFQIEYPRFFPNPKMLQQQADFILSIYKRYANPDLQRRFRAAETSIIRVIAGIRNESAINLIALFDQLHTNPDIPIIKLCGDDNRPHLIKSYVTYQGSTPSDIRKGIIIGIKMEDENISTTLFMNIQADGRMQIYCDWREDLKINFTKQITILDKFVNPLVRELNAVSGHFMIGKFLEFNNDTTNYDQLSVSFLWPEILANEEYNKLRKKIMDLFDLDIFQPSKFTNLSPDTLLFVFMKGDVYINPTIIEQYLPTTNFNYYSWLSDPDMERLWTSKYNGCNTGVTHRAIDIKFDVKNIKNYTFLVLKLYLFGIIDLLGLKPSNEIKEYKKKINKLTSLDPQLFKFAIKDAAGKRKVYSALCQNPMQPVIYTMDEFTKLSEKEKKKLVKYWNFTLNQPAYYECPSAKYPHLTMLTHKHPEGFCLPCCQITERQTSSYATCIQEHRITEEKNKQNNRYIIKFSMAALDPERIGYADFIQTVVKKPLYLWGVKQILPSGVRYGFLASLLILCQDSPTQFVRKAAQVVNDQAVILDLINIFIKQDETYVCDRDDREWVRIFIMYAIKIYNINVILLNVDRQTVVTNYGYHQKNAIIIEKPGMIFEPVLQINTAEYFRFMEGRTAASNGIGMTYWPFSDVKLFVIQAIMQNKLGTSIPVDLDNVKYNYYGFVVQSGRKYFHVPSEYVLSDRLSPEELERLKNLPEKPEDIELNFNLLRSFIDDQHIQVTQIITSEGRVKGVSDSLNRIFLTDTDIKDVPYKAITVDWFYPLDIALKIFMEKAAFSDWGDQTLIDIVKSREAEYYRHTIYKHLFFLLVLCMAQFKDSDKREQIINALQNGETLAKIDMDGRDRARVEHIVYYQNYLNLQREKYDKIKLALDLAHFEFDNANYYRLKKLTKDQLHGEFRNMLGPYIKVEALTPEAIKKSLILSYELELYAKNPIVIDDEKFLEQLVDDFNNPFLDDIFKNLAFIKMFDEAMGEIDFSMLSLHPGEKLTMIYPEA